MRTLKPRLSDPPSDASRAQTDEIASADENTRPPTDDGDMQASVEWPDPRRAASPEVEPELAPSGQGGVDAHGRMGRAQAIRLLEEVARDMPGEVTLPEQSAVEAAADWKSIQTPPADAPADRAAGPE